MKDYKNNYLNQNENNYEKSYNQENDIIYTKANKSNNKNLLIFIPIVFFVLALLFPLISKLNKNDNKNNINNSSISTNISNSISSSSLSNSLSSISSSASSEILDKGQFNESGISFNYSEWTKPIVETVNGQTNVITNKNGYKLIITKIPKIDNTGPASCLSNEYFTNIDDKWVKVNAASLSQASGLFYIMKENIKDEGYAADGGNNPNTKCLGSAFQSQFATHKNENSYIIQLTKPDGKIYINGEGSYEIALNDTTADEIVKSFKLD